MIYAGKVSTDYYPLFKKVSTGIIEATGGTYNLSQPFEITQPLTLVGKNIAKTIINGDIIVRSASVYLGHFTLNGSLTVDFDDDAADSFYGQYLLIQRSNKNGIHLRNGCCIRLDSVKSFAHQGHGLWMHDDKEGAGDNVNACVITNFISTGNNGDGIHIDKSSSNRIDVTSQGNGGYGVYCNRAYNQIEGYVEGNGKGPLFVGDSCFESSFDLRVVDGKPSGRTHLNKFAIRDGSGKWMD